VSPSCRGQPGLARPTQPTLDAVRVQPSSPPSQFPAFCAAVRTWLRDAAYLDPSLAAVADLVEAMSGTCDASAEEQVAYLASDATDMHGALGASALLGLWRGYPR